jgi:hypothetical protein
MDRLQDLPAASFSSARSADVRVELPVVRLPPGPYLLTVDAAAGADDAPVSRDVRFTVQ